MIDTYRRGINHMRITQEFLNKLSPVELSFIRTGIDKLYKEKVKPNTTNYENVKSHVCKCPHCGSTRFVKNGFNPKHKQKYRCKSCKSIFMATTNTLFTHSKTDFNIWSTFIAGELNGLTLEQQVVATGLSIVTCFNMRHKLYKAISKIQKDVILSGDIELDLTYTSINLKGSKNSDMPRISKTHGKHKNSPYSHRLRGTSHHKICIVAAIDENDHTLFKIGGLGRESYDLLNGFKRHFSVSSNIISDDSHSIQTFVSKNNFKSDVIPSGLYKTVNGNTIASVNQLHAEAKNLIRQKHGISTRHLQGYLDWIVFKKKLRYTIDIKKWKLETYMEAMMEPIPFKCKDITKLPMPIDLYKAYGEYHYGIYANIN